ncbi:MAG: hypothetical protein FGM32_04885, partial [Candidatus Kapabacteria bacterium]|nr:hypothetical protein [Candidatus Kapabacteria bacterium]
MKRFLPLAFIATLVVANLSAQDITTLLGRREARTELQNLFTTLSRGEVFSNSEVPSVPHEASFVSIDQSLFQQARQLPDNIPFSLTVNLPGIGPVQAIVARYRVIDETTELLAMTDDGPVKIPAPQSVLIRGFIPSMKGSFVVAAIYSDYATGMITTGADNGDRTFLISPLKIDKPQSTMVIYDQSLVPSRNEWACHAKEPENFDARIRERKQSENSQVRYRQIKIALEGDFDYYIDHNRDLAKATKYAESVVAASSAIYERDVTATLIIAQLNIWTTNDPYTGTNTTTLLGQFANRWTANFGNVNRTLAHLLSGINGIGGVAYLETMCNKQYGYAVSGLNNNITYPAAGYVWDTDVFSHETGHNVGSPHTFNCGWAPPIDSCVAAEGGTCYTGTKAVKGTIMSYCHLTAQGTNLLFHPRVIAVMQNRLQNDACTPLTYELTVKIADTVRACRNGDKIVSATATAGAEPYTYRWFSSYFDTVTTVNSFLIKQPRNFSFFVEARDAVGNVARDTCVMTVFEPPQAKLKTASTKLCSGKSADIQCEITGGKQPFSYQWLRNGQLVANVGEFYSQRVDDATRVSVIVTDGNGCADTANLDLKPYDFQMTFQPASITMPQLPPCKNSFLQEYTLRNTGADTIVIDSVSSGAAIKPTMQLPITIVPGASVKVPITVTVRGTGTIRDDILFLEKNCRWRFRTPVTGQRSLPKIFSALPFDLGTKILCDSATPRTIVLGFNNPTSFTMRFSAVYAKSTGTTVAFDRAPFVLPAGADRSALINLTSALPAGTYTDTLTLTYESDGCEGSFTAPIIYRNAQVKITNPTAVNFDTVKSDSKPIVRTLPISATFTGAPSATVQYVEITDPFVTSMKQGLVLPNGKTTNVTVTLDPKDITAGGVLKGTLRYLVDSCAAPYDIQLTANVVVVGVDEDKGADAARISVSDDGIVVSDARGRVEVYDLRGQLVAS